MKFELKDDIWFYQYERLCLGKNKLSKPKKAIFLRYLGDERVLIYVEGNKRNTHTSLHKIKRNKNGGKINGIK